MSANSADWISVYHLARWASRAIIGGMNAQQQQDETPRQSRTLAGQVAIVTGASRGIGRAAALAFAAEGAAVALAARDADALAANVAEITAAGGRALAVPTDVADEDSVAQLFARTEAAFGPVTILVNAAGAVANRPFAEMDTATWDSVLNTNLRGTFLCCRAAFQTMQARLYDFDGKGGDAAGYLVEPTPSLRLVFASRTGTWRAGRCVARWKVFEISETRSPIP